MLERDIEKKVSDYAKSKGWLSYKFTSPSNRAVPDRIYLRGGNTLFIEFKAPGKKPTKLQLHAHKQFRQHGFIVQVIDTVDAGKAIIDIYTTC